jgi:hypothetical protein
MIYSCTNKKRTGAGQMLLESMNAFQVAKREYSEARKAQYTDKKDANGGAKTYFRASELGSSDRKIIYGFFAHNLPKIPKSAQNLRQLENGDYVHERYQKQWEEMGVLISMEERLSSKDDEYLAQFDWEWSGHYDGLLDINIMRAHALGKVTLNTFFNEETETWELEVELDEAYANSIGIFDEEGNLNPDYEETRPVMVADIKTMNPWGFKRLKEQADVSGIQGYIDQIMYYMYMHNTPYGSLFVESKDNNDVCEVQVLWTDLHDSEEEPFKYDWDADIHGEPDSGKVRVRVNSEWFFGGEGREGSVPRLTRLWDLKQKIEEADEAGDMATLAEIFPDRCADKQDAFPCSWGHKTGKPTYCEFYDHCWNQKTGGRAIKPFEAVPADAIWEFEDEDGNTIKVDNRKVPEGINYDTFAILVDSGALKLEMFLIQDSSSSEEEEDEESPSETSFNEDNLFSATGELNLSNPVADEDGTPKEAVEYITDELKAKGKKAIDCVNCGKQIVYQKLGAGNVKPCPHCKHRNTVTRG